MSTALLVALGAAVGAGARWLLDRAVGERTGRPLLGLLVVNLLGCLLAGLALGVLGTGAGAASPLVLTGLLGGFTTASALAAQAASARPAVAAALLAGHLAGGTALAGLGLVVGRVL